MIGLSSGLEGCVGVVIRVQLVWWEIWVQWPKDDHGLPLVQLSTTNSTYYQNCTYIEVMEPKGWFFFNAEQTLILKVE